MGILGLQLKVMNVCYNYHLFESTHTTIVTTYLGRVEFKHEELSNKPTDGNNIEHGVSKQLYIMGLQDITSHSLYTCTVLHTTC